MNGDTPSSRDRGGPNGPNQLVEKVEVLDGSRSRKVEIRRRQAVRIEDLQGIIEISAKLKSAKAAGSTPTKAEFDALVDDVTMLFNRLTAVAAALQAKILP